MALATTVLPSCSGDSTAPSSGVGAPTLSSPAEDAVAAQPVTLTVNNATTTAAGARTYDFQVAESQAALTTAGGALISSGIGIAEGAGGVTSYVVSRTLDPGKRYYWRARAVQGGEAGPWSLVFRFRIDVAPNPAPVIQTLGAAGNRAEANTDLALNAVVQDGETSPSSLVYEWTATGGDFSGTGPSVRWRAPNVLASSFDLTLTVIERYTVSDPDGRLENRENKVSATTRVHVNNSSAELSNLALTFIDDFVHSERSPEFCVRNFSDTCPGKRDELGDIERNRRDYVNDPGRSSFSLLSIEFNAPGNPPAGATFATVRVRCSFAATEKATGIFGIAQGTCRLTSVYENFQWRLCESRFDAPTLGPFRSRFVF